MAEPVGHLLRDLQLDVPGMAGDEAVGSFPVVPEIVAADGGATIGVITTLVDVIGGIIALDAVAPDWIATADAAVHRFGIAPVGSTVTARGRIARRGSTTLVTEVELTADGNTPVATSTMTFAVLPANGHSGNKPDPKRIGIAPGPDAGLRTSLADELGIDATGGAFRMPVTARTRNSIDALQGGVTATFADLAAVHTAGGGTCVDLDLTYLAAARVGPVGAHGELLGDDGARALVRLTLRDEGADERLVALATAVVLR